MRILTVVYGEKHVELFRRACLKSLNFSENRKAIYANNTVWTICTDATYIDYLRKQVDIYFPELEVRFRSSEDLRDYIDPIQSAIISQIEECLELKVPLLFAPPDTIFSNGTIRGLAEFGKKQDTVVVSPHPRVLPSFLEESMDPYLSPEEMVTRAWKHLHQSWEDAERGHVRQNSFVGGVTWWREGKEIAVNHRLPTPYFINFTPEDLHYFKMQVSFGGFDHTWPSDILIPRNRYTYLTSSSQAFIVEITERSKNVPPIWPGSVDDFWRKGRQEEHNKHITSYFRGE